MKASKRKATTWIFRRNNNDDNAINLAKAWPRIGRESKRHINQNESALCYIIYLINIKISRQTSISKETHV